MASVGSSASEREAEDDCFDAAQAQDQLDPSILDRASAGSPTYDTQAQADDFDAARAQHQVDGSDLSSSPTLEDMSGEHADDPGQLLSSSEAHIRPLEKAPPAGMSSTINPSIKKTPLPPSNLNMVTIQLVPGRPELYLPGLGNLPAFHIIKRRSRSPTKHRTAHIIYHEAEKHHFAAAVSQELQREGLIPVWYSDDQYMSGEIEEFLLE